MSLYKPILSFQEVQTMKSYKNSDYALNKHSAGIIYRLADKIVEVTLSDYLAENPDKTEDDFRALKALSDADYLEQDRRDYRQTWKNTPIDAIAETEACIDPSPEELVIDAPEEAERLKLRVELGKKALAKLTDIQRRRYTHYHANGLTTREISEIENVTHVAVVYSLNAAEKRIKKFISEQ
jgi:predicted DNA-binding protein YlxM (UPF0122 family)